MCTGLELALIAGTALSAGGSLLGQQQASAQAQAIADARNRVLQQTLAKNDKIAEQSRELFNQRRDEIQPDQVQQNQAKETQERTDAGEAAVRAPSAGEVPLSGSAPSVVSQAFEKRMGSAVDKGKAEAQSLGKLGGYGDFWFGEGLGNAAAGRDMGVNQNYASGNLALMPILQDYAEIGATKAPNPIPAIMQAAGSALGAYAGGGAGSGFLGGKAIPMPRARPADAWAPRVGGFLSGI